MSWGGPGGGSNNIEVWGICVCFVVALLCLFFVGSFFRMGFFWGVIYIYKKIGGGGGMGGEVFLLSGGFYVVVVWFGLFLFFYLRL